MNNDNKAKLEDLIEQISIANHPGTLDDDYPDMMADAEGDSIVELVNYIYEKYDIRAEE